MGRLYYLAKELYARPQFPGNFDHQHFYFHFQPARPADLFITRDPLSGDLNMMAGTMGPLTAEPYTIALHVAKASFDSARNIQSPGAEAVVAIPDRKRVVETWVGALPIPRGIYEAEVAGLTSLPSRVVSIPGILECPINYECKIELVKEWHTHYAVFLHVLATSIDEDFLDKERLDIISSFPTYEVDDQTNQFNGSIERLGVNGELLECPGFPIGPKKGEREGLEEWISELNQAGYLSSIETTKLEGWISEWNVLVKNRKTKKQAMACKRLTRAIELMAWEEWKALHNYLAQSLKS